MNLIFFNGLFLGGSGVFSDLMLLISDDVIEHFDGIVVAVINPHAIDFAVKVKLLCGTFPGVKLLEFKVEKRKWEGVVGLMRDFFPQILKIEFGLCRWYFDSLSFRFYVFFIYPKVLVRNLVIFFET